MAAHFHRTTRGLFAQSVVWTGLVLLLLALAGPSSAQGEPISWEAYWQRVEDTLEWVSGAPAAGEWQQQAKAWAAVQAVRLPNRGTTPVDTSYLVALLNRQPPDAEAVKTYLQGLIRLRDRHRQVGSGADELAQLEKILAQPEFQWRDQQPNLLEQLYERVMRFIVRLLNRLFPDSAGEELPLLRWLFYAAGFAAFAWVIFYIVRSAWRSLLPESELGDEPGSEGEVQTAQQAARRAQQLSAAGDFRQALRFQYLAALLLLDERGLLSYHRSQTNREVLRQVAGRPLLAERLRSVIDTFDRVWYGFQPIDEAEYARYSRQVAEIESDAKNIADAKSIADARNSADARNIPDAKDAGSAEGVEDTASSAAEASQGSATAAGRDGRA